jgi:hypothetical protein
MVKEAYYFSHDANARNDPKICELRADWGWAGYGIFWALIEIMRDQESYSIKESQLKAAAFQLRLTEKKLHKFVTDCVRYGLFISQDEHIVSISFQNRMKKRNEISLKRAEAGKKGGEKVNHNNNHTEAIAKQSESKTQAIDEQEESTKGKERKGNKKETKGKGKESDLIDPPEILTPNEATQKAIAERGFTEYEGSNLIASCLDWHRSKGNQMKDWQAACRTWIRKQNKQPSTDEYDFSGIRHAANNRTS